MSARRVLGISAFYHDSAAALVWTGRSWPQRRRSASPAASTIRPSRRPPGLVPRQSGLTLEDLDSVVFYDKPWVKFERMMETYLGYAPRGSESFLYAEPMWLGEKRLRTGSAARAGGARARQARPLAAAVHRASRQPRRQRVLSVAVRGGGRADMDGVGEWATTTTAVGRGSELDDAQGASISRTRSGCSTPPSRTTRAFA